MNKRRHKLLLLAALSMGTLCETVGCPQLLGNALRDGTRSFLDVGLTTVLLNSLSLDALLGITTDDGSE